MTSSLFFLLLALGPGIVPIPPGPSPGEYVAGISLGRVWEQDPQGGPALAGYRLGFTAFSRSASADYGFAGTWYAEWKRSRAREIFAGGLEVAYPYLEWSRVGFGPRLRLALQGRTASPHRGLDGVVGAGLEAGLWVSQRLQIAALADWNVGIRAGARRFYSLNLRMMMWNE